MKTKNTSKINEGDLENDLVCATEFTGFLQRIPVSNEDIELYKRMYGGGPYGDNETFYN